MKRFWFILIFVLIIDQHLKANDSAADPNAPTQNSQPASNEPGDPNEILRTTCDKVVSVLQNESLDQNSKTKLLDEIISPFFDFDLMSKLSHWENKLD